MPTSEPEATADSSPLPPIDEPADRSKRIAAMLARWRSEDVSDEPDWDVRDVQRVRLREEGLHVGDEP